jgi:dihydroorotate dehydrogenase
LEWFRDRKGKEMFKLSNGHIVEWVVASGALGYFGKGAWWGEHLLRWLGLIDPSLFTIVAKTVTFEKRKGNYRWYWPPGCIRFLNQNGDDSRFGLWGCEGVVNAYELTNPGCEWWKNVYWIQALLQKRISLIPSIFSDGKRAPQEIRKMVMSFDELIGIIVAIELNVSCPNASGDTLTNTKKIIESCENAKEVSQHPLILKLSVVHNIDEILPRIKGLVEAIDINSVPWRVIFPYYISPFAHLGGGGGVSGKIAQPYIWDFVRKLKDKTDIPVICPSVWNYEDIEKLRKLGADAISFGSVFTRYPWRPTSYVKRDMRQN